MSAYPRLVSGYLNAAAMTVLQAELEKHRRLLNVVQASLPEYLAHHCRHCVQKSDKLILYVDSPGFATQIRFHSTALLTSIHDAAPHRFTEIQVRNLIPADGNAKRPDGRLRSTKKAGEHILATAENSASNDIREAMLRLGQTLERKRKPCADHPISG